MRIFLKMGGITDLELWIMAENQTAAETRFLENFVMVSIPVA